MLVFVFKTYMQRNALTDYDGSRNLVEQLNSGFFIHFTGSHKTFAGSQNLFFKSPPLCPLAGSVLAFNMLAREWNKGISTLKLLLYLASVLPIDRKKTKDVDCMIRLGYCDNNNTNNNSNTAKPFSRSCPTNSVFGSVIPKN